MSPTTAWLAMTLSFLLKSGTNLSFCFPCMNRAFRSSLTLMSNPLFLLSKEAILGKNYLNWPVLDARTIDLK